MNSSLHTVSALLVSASEAQTKRIGALLTRARIVPFEYTGSARQALDLFDAGGIDGVLIAEPVTGSSGQELALQLKKRRCMAVLLLVTDHVLGYQGWSVNYGIPSIILFADIAIVFLILVNRMNWQSYFMYQIAITLFSFIPIALWAAGFITQPVMAIITVILSVLILTMTVLLGDRRVKNELIRRFHL